jgi:hypothetical protein
MHDGMDDDCRAAPPIEAAEADLGDLGSWVMAEARGRCLLLARESDDDISSIIDYLPHLDYRHDIITAGSRGDPTYNLIIDT